MSDFVNITRNNNDIISTYTNNQNDEGGDEGIAGLAAQLADITQNVRSMTGSTYGQQLQNLINLSTITNGKIELPLGSITLDDITLPSGKMFEFVGKGWSYDSGYGTKILTDSGHSAFIINNGANGNTFKDIYFHGGGNGKAIDGTYGNKTRIENCLIENYGDQAIYLKQGLCVVKDCFIRSNNGTGLTVNSDSWVINNEISVNTGVGLKLLQAGVRVIGNLINTNGSHGIYCDGTVGGTILFATDISHNYFGENTGYDIFMNGVGSNINTFSMSDNYTQHVAGSGSGGIKLVQCRNITIGNFTLLGGGNGANKNDLEAISLDTCSYIQINGLNSQFTTKEDILMNNCTDCSISGVNSYNHANSATLAANQYSIRDIGGTRNKFNDIKITDTRGGSGFSKGIQITSTAVTIIDYYPYGTTVTDSFATGTRVFMYNGDGFQVGKTIFLDNLVYFQNGVAVYTGTGVPAISAGIGSLYLRADGGANTTLYVKESGNFTTGGWVAK